MSHGRHDGLCCATLLRLAQRILFPGQQRLADDIGVSRQTANEYIQDLKRKGFVKVTRLGQGRTNIYELKVTKG